MTTQTPSTAKKRILSGAKPTADSLHLGNYIGAVRNWVDMQAEYDAVAKSLGAELDRCIAWSYETRPATPRTAPLPAALMPIDKAYLP